MAEIGEGDILLNSDLEITFKNGDFNVGDAPEQHVGAIINASKGNFRRYPTLGAEIHRYIDSPQLIREIEQAIRLELSKDGYIIDNIDISTENGEITNIKILECKKVTDDTGGLN